MRNKIFELLVKISKRFTRGSLYTWLDQKVEVLSEEGSGNLKILNIGAGGDIYEHLRPLKDKGAIIQVDIDEERSPDVVADICDMSVFEDNSIDMIFIMEVLEHVKEPHKAIKEIHRVLKPGGQLILSVPFVYPIHSEPYDYYRFTKYGIAYLLEDFSNVDIRERTNYLDSLYILSSRVFIVEDRCSRYLGGVFFLLSLAVYPIVFLFSKFYKGTHATMGYFVTANA